MEQQNINGVVNSLRSLFSGYGFSEYRMSKFEEYDLYVKNKDFLISDSIITFTDTSGKLLALKPDVTLSIVKNTKIENDIKKVFYNEKVYRASSLSDGYKEISQIGLECIGEIDDFNVAEILTLAVESLKMVSSNFVLEVSPIELLLTYVDRLNLDSLTKSSVYKCVNEKSLHDLKQILSNVNVSVCDVEKLCAVLDVYGKIDEVVLKLKEIFNDTEYIGLVKDFENTLSCLPNSVKDFINVDCSTIESAKYYNSITFKGYINGIPKEVLSGGRYDGLPKRMGKDCKAIGFAIYLDEFDRFFTLKNQFDVDVLIKYCENSDKIKVLEKVQELYKSGKRVRAVRSIPSKLTYKEIIEI